MKKIITLIVMNIVLFTFVGCGGGSSGGGSTPTATVQTGIFVDAPVQGLEYSTPTTSGYTNALGEFQYKTGETVTFKIGNFVLGSAIGGQIMTPLTLTGENNLNNISAKATNIARLLQSLDMNTSNHGNIQIPIALHDLNVTNVNIENDSDLNVIFTAAKQITSTSNSLIDTATAKNNMINFIQLYSQYSIFQNKRYFGGSTQYYVLNMPSNGNVDLTKYYASVSESNSDALGTGFVQLYDSNMTLIKRLDSNESITAGTYIVKISGLTSGSYVDVYSPLLNPASTFSNLTNKRYFGGSTQYYVLNMPSNGNVDFTKYWAGNDNIADAFGYGFVRLYDSNMTLIRKLNSNESITAGTYIVKISGLTSGSYVDVYSPLLN